MIVAKKRKRCNCDLCTGHRRLKTAVKKRDTDALIALATKFFEAWGDEADELSYCQSILDGSWPTSVEMLENALSDARERRENEPALKKAAEALTIPAEAMEMAFPSFSEEVGEA